MSDHSLLFAELKPFFPQRKQHKREKSNLKSTHSFSRVCDLIELHAARAAHVFPVSALKLHEYHAAKNDSPLQSFHYWSWCMEI